jgi:eukaryotic-like serine/threonine-protein kinase
VMELVEGSGLRGPLPLDKALRIAKQIVEALEAGQEKASSSASRAGEHQDRAGGRGEGARFRLGEGCGTTSVSGGPGNSPTLTNAGTKIGAIMGTAAYMAQEQARGHEVDHGAGNRAFGVVLCEIPAGKRTFQGDSIPDVLAALLTEQPDWRVHPMERQPGAEQTAA